MHRMNVKNKKSICFEQNVIVKTFLTYCMYAYSYRWHKNKFLLATKYHVLFEWNFIKIQTWCILIGILRITTSLMVYVMFRIWKPL